MDKILYRLGVPAYRIVLMRLPDIEGVLAIERRSFPNPWSPNIFEAEVRNVSGVSYPFVLMSAAGAVAGYLCMWKVVDELHINNVAVATELQGGGLGWELLEFSEEFALKHGCRRITLEVRFSNDGARKLYRRFGFLECGTRKNYYETGEDAVVMTKFLA